ncbi:MAG TPA: polysaccharide deacetylase family protein [Dongiaceae bacterium]|nr:polysaccharide deacetylase family protein [Dongiaceae bacterium]
MIPIRLSLGAWSPVIRRIAAERPSMAITFDDGPDPDSTPVLIEALAKAGARSTHFLLGERVERHPALVAALVAAGHDVYAHGWSHDRYDASQAADAAAATGRTEALLARHRPTPRTYLIRLPFNAGFTSAAMHKAMRGFHPHVQFAWWSHTIADFRIAQTCQDEAAIRAATADAIAQFEARRDLEGGVLLLHDAPLGGPEAPAALTTKVLVPEALRVLKAKGFDLVALKPQPEPPLSRFAFRSPQPVMVIAGS